ncbi:phage protein Gp36 family protein [Pinibacter soli]|uniref:DUF1320 family protein n=1 Tax=Pinibacter soli TaxID=3044211 RepID=A0ABT6R9G0_9BACT|nr:phage protein Gp36 family protein [Pinibacter soli]MDI3319138.1 DUF1320 family protein [Pinibacter soli]
MYIQKKDYRIRISLALFDLLLQNATQNDQTEEDVLTEASKIAEDTIASFLGNLYDIVPEFSKAGTQRNFYILSLAISIALYNIYQNADDNDIPEKVIKNYDDAMEELLNLSKGKTNLDLPAKSTGSTDDNGNNGSSNGANGPEIAVQDGSGLRRFGSNPKRSHMP